VRVFAWVLFIEFGLYYSWTIRQKNQDDFYFEWIYRLYAGLVNHIFSGLKIYESPYSPCSRQFLLSSGHEQQQRPIPDSKHIKTDSMFLSFLQKKDEFDENQDNFFLEK